MGNLTQAVMASERHSRSAARWLTKASENGTPMTANMLTFLFVPVTMEVA